MDVAKNWNFECGVTYSGGTQEIFAGEWNTYLFIFGNVFWTLLEIVLNDSSQEAADVQWQNISFTLRQP